MLPTPVPPTSTELEVPKVLFKGKYVSKKGSNAPFFVHQQHLLKKAQQQKLSTSSSMPGSTSRNGLADDPPSTSKRVLVYLAWLGSLCGGTLKYSVVAVVLSLILSKMVTEQWFWGYEGKYVQLSYYFPPPSRNFTVSELSKYDGRQHPSILLSIKGQVYNVTSNPQYYGPGGSYHHFAARDASRAFATGCFKSGLTFDTRGLSASQLKGLNHWSNFFANSPKYPRVGQLLTPEVAPDTPLPKDCDPKLEGGAL